MDIDELKALYNNNSKLYVWVGEREHEALGFTDVDADGIDDAVEVVDSRAAHTRYVEPVEIKEVSVVA